MSAVFQIQDLLLLLPPWSRLPAANGNGWALLTKRQIAEALGIDTSDVRKMLDAGAPVGPANRNGRPTFNVVVLGEWAAANWTGCRLRSAPTLAFATGRSLAQRAEDALVQDLSTETVDKIAHVVGVAWAKHGRGLRREERWDLRFVLAEEARTANVENLGGHLFVVARNWLVDRQRELAIPRHDGAPIVGNRPAWSEDTIVAIVDAMRQGEAMSDGALDCLYRETADEAGYSARDLAEIRARIPTRDFAPRPYRAAVVRTALDMFGDATALDTLTETTIAMGCRAGTAFEYGDGPSDVVRAEREIVRKAVQRRQENDDSSVSTSRETNYESS